MAKKLHMNIDKIRLYNMVDMGGRDVQVQR